jgi:phospholipase C
MKTLMETIRKLGTARRAAAMAAAVGLAAGPLSASPAMGQGGSDTATPIQHVVVIFQENVSFDHYFGTYPNAANSDGVPFQAKSDTPSVNGLSPALLNNNPNMYNGAGANPFRLSHSQSATCDEDHNYGAEQLAFDLGLMDNFPATTGSGCGGGYDYGHGAGIVMGYYDGNTVTALWNYAQYFALNDNFFGSTFGPSTPGALNLVAGNTYPATPSDSTPKVVDIAGDGAGTLVGDLDPTGDICSGGVTITMGGRNIGDLLNAKGISWGSFMGGFDLNVTNPNGTTGCNRSHNASTGGTITDYIPHHAWFQYFPSTANPTHARPNVPPSEYGTSADTSANHEYDILDFFAALKAGNLPAVSFLKAPAFEDGHAGYSDPLDEQSFLVTVLNALQKSPFWNSTAVFITWDDSDGWYDHQMGPIINSSSVYNSVNNAQYGDNLSGTGKCGNGTPLAGVEGRCGYGPRIPMLVVSAWARRNFVSHSLADFGSLLRFIEDNWGTGRIGNGSFDAVSGSVTNMFNFNGESDSRRLFLDPTTGQPVGRR